MKDNKEELFRNKRKDLKNLATLIDWLQEDREELRWKLIREETYRKRFIEIYNDICETALIWPSHKLKKGVKADKNSKQEQIHKILADFQKTRDEHDKLLNKIHDIDEQCEGIKDQKERQELINNKKNLWIQQNKLWIKQNKLKDALNNLDPITLTLFEILPFKGERVPPFILSFYDKTSLENQVEQFFEFLINITPIWEEFKDMLKKYISINKPPILDEKSIKRLDCEEELSTILKEYKQKRGAIHDSDDLDTLNVEYDLIISDLIGYSLYNELWERYCKRSGQNSFIEMIGPDWKKFYYLEKEFELNPAMGKVAFLSNKMSYHVNDEQILFLRYLTGFNLDRFSECEHTFCKKIIVITRTGESTGRHYCSKKCRQNAAYRRKVLSNNC